MSVCGLDRADPVTIHISFVAPQIWTPLPHQRKERRDREVRIMAQIYRLSHAEEPGTGSSTSGSLVPFPPAPGPAESNGLLFPSLLA